MAKTKQKVQMPSSIRKKMTAAVSMLLVACIMLVSSTYAWFVLSTAPEVTGITTQVGANGNLEIALLDDNTYLKPTDVKTEIGDSMDLAGQDITEANKTWGNLVDLKDASYGLSNIVLTPSELNVVTYDNNELALGSALLRTPEYGSDGRVASVTANTVSGKYDTEKTIFAYSNAGYGVRAIGTASSLTVRQTKYRSALSNVSTYSDAAKSKANLSLTTYGSDLANIMVAIAAGTTEFDKSNLTTITNLISTINEANASIGNAIKQAAIAYAFSDGVLADTVKDEEIGTIAGNIEAIDASAVTIDGLNTALGSYSVTWPESLNTAVNTYTKTQSALNNATGLITKYSNNETLSQNEILEIVTPLVDRNYMFIGETNMGGSKDEVINAVMNSYTSGGGRITIEMATGSGVYSNISDICGNYSASDIKVTVKGGTVSGFNSDITATATMKTISITEVTVVDGKYTKGSSNSNYYMTVVLTAIKDKGEPAGAATTGNTPISDTFGYTLDFAFRTNAADSKLLLQTAAKQRVYDNSNATGTQGAGSYMSFNATNSFSVDEVVNLMKAIRVAFVSPTVSDSSVNGYEVLAMAKLDFGSTTSTDGDTTANYTTDGNTVKANLCLYDYEYTMDTGVTDVSMGVLNVKDTKSESAEITNLVQNTPKVVSVVVYIDGNYVDNDDVANAVQSMAGQLNLQFASDAELVPMENNALRNVAATNVTYDTLDTSTNPDILNTVSEALGKTVVAIYKGSDGNYYYSTDGANKLMVNPNFNSTINDAIGDSASWITPTPTAEPEATETTEGEQQT